MEKSTDSLGELNKKYYYNESGKLVKYEEETPDGNVKTTYTYTTDNRLATTTINGVLKNAVVYDGNGLKSFELLRKEYETTEHETIIELQEQNAQILRRWVEDFETVEVPVTVETEGTQETTVYQTTGRNYEEAAFHTAYAVGSLAPHLWEDWFEFACTFFEDIGEWLTVPGSEGSSYTIMEEEVQSVTSLIRSVVPREALIIETPYSYDETVSYYEPTSYVYDLTQENAQVLTEHADTGCVAKETYTYGAQGRSSAEKAGVYIYDGRGSVSETYKGGKVTSTLRYDPYGTIVAGLPVQNQIYAYNGEQYTPQTGFIYLRARNYDPSTGTFTSRDTYLGSQTDPVTRNRYTYGNNNPVMYQDPSGHAGIFSRIVTAVRAVVSTVTKVVSKVAAKKTTSTSSAVKSAVSGAVKSATKTAESTAKNNTTKKSTTVVNTAKAALVKATTAVVNKASGASTSVVKEASTSSSGSSSSSNETLTKVAMTCLRYVMPAGPSKMPNVPSTWEETKDAIERKLDQYIWVRDNVAPVIQLASSWWIKQNEPYEMQVARTTMDLLAKNSVIANTVTAISMGINKAANTIAEKWQASPVGQWYEKNRIAIDTIIGTVAVGALAVVAAVAGPAALGISAVGVLAVGGIVGTAGAGVGAFDALVSYYEENGTIDGSTQEVLKGASRGFRNATVGVAIDIAAGAAFSKLKTWGKSLPSKPFKGGTPTKGVGNPVKVEGKGNTGRILPNTLNEQMAMNQVLSNPLEGATKVPLEMNDSRWPATDGWVKMQSVVQHEDGTKTTIHFVYNEVTGAFDDFKFK